MARVVAGESVAVVAQSLGVSTDSVYSWMKAQGVKAPARARAEANAERAKRAEALVDQGVPVAVAAASVGLSVKTFRYYAFAAGERAVSPTGKQRTPQQKADAVARVVAGESVASVAKSLSVSDDAVYLWLAKAGQHGPKGSRAKWRMLREQAWQLFEAGVGLKDIAAKVGMSLSTVRRWIDDYPMPATLSSAASPAATTPHTVMKAGRGVRLTLKDRIAIQIGLSEGKSFRQIGHDLSRHHDVVGREVRRNGVIGIVDGKQRYLYDAVTAQDNAQARLRRPKQMKLDANPKLREVVLLAMARRWSPKRIEVSLVEDFPEDETMRISHEAIYQAIYIQGAGSLRKELQDYIKSEQVLIRGGTRRRPRKRTAGLLSNKDWVKGAEITERPPEVDDRAVPGHWEGDLVIGAGGKSALITLVERTTRYTLLGHLPDEHTSKTVVATLQKMVADINRDMLKTITWDQGVEMSETKHQLIAEACEVYFCNPHSPWQRPSNENTNGEIRRRFYPKGTDFAQVSPQHVQWVQDELNDTPRVVLNGKRPRTMMNQLLNSGASTT